MARNSIYLENKAANLEQALRFFMGGSHGEGRISRLTAFLDQIDFWDWEVEELRFSYANFAERATAWSTCEPGGRAADLGIRVRADKAENVRLDRLAKRRAREYSLAHKMRQGHAQPDAELDDQVITPQDSLRAVQDVWHEILYACEKNLLESPATAANVRKAGVPCLLDLSKYRKVALAVSTAATAG